MILSINAFYHLLIYIPVINLSFVYLIKLQLHDVKIKLDILSSYRIICPNNLFFYIFIFIIYYFF